MIKTNNNSEKNWKNWNFLSFIPTYYKKLCKMISKTLILFQKMIDYL